MRAGELRQRLTIEEQTITRDEFGAERALWTEVAEVWGAVDDSGGSEQFVSQAEQRQAERLTKIKIRWLDGVSVKMRVAHGGRFYEIERIERDPTMRREMLLYCREVNPP